jgi:GNAT superfamily N-acetyltransferase
MTTIENGDNTSVIYRPVEKQEQQQAIDLWYAAFTPPAGYFERYFDNQASPYYQEGDTLGGWIDGKLVSALHIRRLYIRSRDDNTEYLCGAISNVATLKEHRRHGYSRHLLQMAITKMEQSGEFDISVLGTGQPNHYSVLGWEQISLPSPISIEWNRFSSSGDNNQWYSINDISSSNYQLLLDNHSNKPRTYQFNRSPISMFQHWTGWNWARENAIICLLRDAQQGYVVITKPDSADDVYVSEWRASNIDVERKLLKLAANEIRRRQPQIKIIRFHTVPQYMSLEELDQWAGSLSVSKNDHTMIRNIRLSNETLKKIKAAYVGGHATFWGGDYF